jgi:hypothetical protein
MNLMKKIFTATLVVLILLSVAGSVMSAFSGTFPKSKGERGASNPAPKIDSLSTTLLAATYMAIINDDIVIPERGKAC